MPSSARRSSSTKYPIKFQKRIKPQGINKNGDAAASKPSSDALAAEAQRWRERGERDELQTFAVGPSQLDDYEPPKAGGYPKSHAALMDEFDRKRRGDMSERSAAAHAEYAARAEGDALETVPVG